MSILRVKSPFAVDQKGVHRVLRSGDLVDSSDPVVKGRESFFEAVEVAATRNSPKVEQATAAPGERRSVTRKPKRGSDAGADAE